MLWLRITAVVAFALATWLGEGIGLAQSVVLVRPPESDRVLVEAFNRLRAELGLQDFEVIVADPPAGSNTPEAIDALAKSKAAFAAISFMRSADTTSADVWIADRATGKTTVRTLALKDAADAPTVLAVRAVDLLRESLRELGPEPPPPDVANVDRAPLPPQVRAWVKPKPPAWLLRLEATMLVTPQGLTPAYGVGLALGRRLSDHFVLGVAAAGPLVGGTYEATTGKAIAHQELAWLELIALALHDERFELGASLGAGVYHLEARSEVDPPLASRSDDVLSALGSVGAFASVHATEAVALTASVAALAVTPRPGVAIGPERTLFREPLVRASLGMGVSF